MSADLDALPVSALEALRDQLELELMREGCRRYTPQVKQREFHDTRARERCFMAGNQIGKTYAAANEMAIHLTGEYPDWWQGKRFDHPIAAWAAGVTGESTRDTLQRLLLGRPGQEGTGAIPADAIITKTMARGVADAVDTVIVRHRFGQSTLSFKSYERGRAKWQGETLHVVAFDEEPPPDIYTEGLTRTNATNGIVWVTFTPLLGMSEVVKRYLQEPTRNRVTVRATIHDAEHYTETERREIIESYPAHERDARAKGIPILGSGRIFPVAEEAIAEEGLQIPRHWPRICGMDFGWDHPTAAVWLAWDRDADVIHLYDCYRVKEQTPIMHAAAIRARGDWIPVAWPHDGLQHDKGSGQQIAKQYEDQGLKMLANRATFEDGTNGVEAGVLEMLERMQTARLRVARHLEDWFAEFRLYHRKNGKIVKENDDLIDATRYAMMMLRHAVVRTQIHDTPEIPNITMDMQVGY